MYLVHEMRGRMSEKCFEALTKKKRGGSENRETYCVTICEDSGSKSIRILKKAMETAVEQAWSKWTGRTHCAKLNIRITVWRSVTS